MLLAGLGLVGGIYDSVTGEDYETARQTQTDVANALTYQPRTEAGKENMEWIGGLLDNDLFNWLAEAGDTAGQSTNDYLEETPVGFAAPLAGILASAAPDLAAGFATGGAGTAAVKGAKALNASRQAAKQRERISPALLDENNSVGSAAASDARSGARSAEALPVPLDGDAALTQGQATRNAAQWARERNLAKEDVGAALAQRFENQQGRLEDNLRWINDGMDRAPAQALDSDYAFGQAVKKHLDTRRKTVKEKTNDLYEQAEKLGDLDSLINIEALGPAFKAPSQKTLMLAILASLGNWRCLQSARAY